MTPVRLCGKCIFLFTIIDFCLKEQLSLLGVACARELIKDSGGTHASCCMHALR